MFPASQPSLNFKRTNPFIFRSLHPDYLNLNQDSKQKELGFRAIIIIKMLNQRGAVEKLKIIMNGSSSSGISSLCLRYVENRYSDDYVPTIGVDFRIKTIEPLGVKLYIWQTRGGERFRSITRSYYRGAHGVIITYNITDRQSFLAVPRWMEEVESTGWQNTYVKVIVGTHLDEADRREVTEQEGLEMAQKYDCKFYEASARDGTNVKEIFEHLTLDILFLLGYSEGNRELGLQKLREPVKLWSPGPINKSCC